ncbi:hypothetical protein CPIN18021_0916 [Campylobacter pinnipediorum subsp. caledonicus]|uniref:Uncharacterized protein n=1 Tax=Campylobacter pinnipediorum subsp. caledonicus TaxID=1874362 RepID=A0A1S6U7J9_9BACT|nr:hypothetical protein CPIN18020_0913 [Campylobacter pinnipediorum subsp. caledonicus]AQW87724.1 hypothetical protein CPIN18021_0916 [Campylobacter pinnipediorum subsp. caledonicus]OPA72146.1 hypothetical protein BB381_00920 [Campylobacter pinnipediorum subsp. caledonicus]
MINKHKKAKIKLWIDKKREHSKSKIIQALQRYKTLNLNNSIKHYKEMIKLLLGDLKDNKSNKISNKDLKINYI